MTYTEEEISHLKTMAVQYALEEAVKGTFATIEQAVEHAEGIYEFLAGDI